LLTPLDLAVSKLSRFSERDREDISSLARHRQVGSSALRRRAQEAIVAYVGSTDRVRGSIETACRIVEDIEGRTIRDAGRRDTL
jgi:porphobilinogen deaminase